MTGKPISIGQIALKLHVFPWKIRRLFETGKLPEPERIGNYRLFTEADIPRIKKALEEAGYLKESAGK